MTLPPARRILSPSGPQDATFLRDEERFFSGLRLPNGTYKATRRGRMPEVDLALVKALGSPRRLQALDVAVSSGVTSVELLAALAQAGHDVQLVASDLMLDAWLWSPVRGLDLLRDRRGRVLQVAVGSTTLVRPHDPSGSPRRRVLQMGFDLLDAVLAVADGGEPAGTRLPLVVETARSDSRITLVEHDLMRPRPEWRGRFDIVRAANVLNRDYFPESVLLSMLGALCPCLAEQGLLVLCRTVPDGGNHASILRRHGGRLELVARVGEGSEVEELALRPSGEDRVLG